MIPSLTVIVCTYNRGSLITETLPTLFNQDVSHDQYKIIIVNNNSNDNTADILLEYYHKYDNLSIIFEQNQGLSFAKNAGMKSAVTEWLVYLDDDAKIPVDFIRKALNNIQRSVFICFGGVYHPWYKYGKPKWYKDEYASNKNKLNDFGILHTDFISGGILAIKTAVLKNYGGFSTDIGMKGNNVAYGEETLLQIKLREDGYNIGYDPNWIIYHLVGQYKLSAKWFLKSGYVSGRDSWIIYKKDPTIKILVVYIYRSIKMLFVNLYKYTIKLFTKDYFIQNWIIDVFRPTILKWGQIIGGIKIVLTKNDKK